MKHAYTDAQLHAAIDGAIKSHPFGTIATREHDSDWMSEKPQRLSIIKESLAALPEPEPPTVDGKTPGQVCFEAWKAGYPWEQANQRDFHRAASAVLAAFGKQSQAAEEANARAEKAEAELAQSEAAFSNYRGFILSALNEAGAPTHHKDVGAPALKPMTPQERIKALPKLPQLRPIAEAGPAPEGCVRVFTNSDYGNASEYQHSGRTHFADIPLPVPAEKVEPETFDAHGKTWTRPSVQKPEDDDPIEWLLDSELEGRREYQADFVSTAKRLEHWEGIAGWRYADEPTPEPLETESEPWTPKVGDVVTLKSGSPDMTVRCFTPEGAALCDWFKPGSERDSATLPVTSLQPA